jgi:hypothetical protein
MGTNYSLEQYQSQAIERDWQAYLGGRCYSPMFDDPGVGKTPKYVVLASRIASHRVKNGARQPVIWLVTENTAKESQREKVLRFDPRFGERAAFDPLTVLVLEGTSDERTTMIQMASAMRIPWVIMNYNQIALHAETLMQMVSDDDVVIFDEADLASPSGQNVSQRFDVAKAMACKTHYRIAATGSMIRNRVDTLYNLFLLLDPDWIEWEAKVELGAREVTMPQPHRSKYWGKRNVDFLNRYGVFDGDKLVDIRRKEELHHRLVDEYGASMTAKDVLSIEHDAPDIITHPLSEGQLHNYNLVKNGYHEMAQEIDWALRRQYGDQRASTLQSFLAQISYARFVPGLSPQNYKRIVQLNKVKRLGKDEQLSLTSYLNLDQFVDDGGNARIDQAVKLCAEFDWANEGGLIFYSPFKEVVKELAAAMQKYCYASRYGFGLITGDVSQHERNTVRQKVADGTCRIVGISNAGGRSIDLVGLNTAVSLITPWTHSETEQAMGRIDRWGQQRTVKTVYMAAENTIEVKHLLPMMGGKGKASTDVKMGKRGRRQVYETITDAYQVLGWL